MPDEFPRDCFPSDESPTDPRAAARQAMRPPLPKRFYRETGAAERDGGFVLTLDGRTARTPARHLLALPTEALALALAAEWAAQGDTVDPAKMPLTRIANSAIDGVASDRSAVVDDLVRYAGSDLVCYRAGEPERLVAEQARVFEPVLAFARDRLGARFVLSEGVMHVSQPEHAVAAVRVAVGEAGCDFRLAALHVMTTLSGSVLIPLAVAAQTLSPEEAWEAAHVDERFQESVWGEDEDAMARRARRWEDFRAAATVYRLAGSRPGAGA
jgi:chaperone required for assembly of F1-ATPase